MHDWCYTTTSCMALEYNLPYFVPYKWKCNGGSPYCGRNSNQRLPSIIISCLVGARKGQGSLCSHQLCECDRTFVNCLAQFACPKKKAMCTSPWRYFQNLFMGLGTGMVSWFLCKETKGRIYLHTVEHNYIPVSASAKNDIIIMNPTWIKKVSW